MLEFLRNNARIVAVLVVAFINSFFVEFDPEAATSFLEQFFTNYSFTVGSALIMLTGYVGERRLVAIEPNTTLTGAAAVLTVLLPLLAPGTDWSSLIAVINQLAATGILSLGAIFGVLLNYFADIRIGRPSPEGNAFNTHNVTIYKLSDLPHILWYGRKAA